MSVSNAIPSTSERAEELYEQELYAIRYRTDMVFCIVFILQWLGGIVAAWLISPPAYGGSTDSHVATAVCLGGAIISLPLVLCLARPGWTLTRYVVAIAQMLDGALLIHLTGGRIETHFHIFGSLAFLAFYRDWRLLGVATLVVVLDHIVRGLLAPLSIYGISQASQFRWVEHAGWILFMDTFLVVAMSHALKLKRVLAERQSSLEANAQTLRTQAVELEDARDRAIESTKIKSQFMANMSHEIRTPMNGVIGMATLLEHTGLTSEQREYSQTIRHSAQALLEVINDILDFSKIEAGKMAVESIPMNLRQIFDEVTALLGARAGEKGIDLRCEVTLDPDLCLIGDPTRWRQVMTNLVGNAVKFTNEGSIVVRATPIREDDRSIQIRVEVIDTGVGIPLDKQECIFESFTQADSGTTRLFGGTGLGLTISRELVRLMGGSLGLESELGKGSTFWIDITMEKSLLTAGSNTPDLSPLISSDSLASEPEPQEVHVLLAEDNVVNQRVACKMLERLGCSVTVVENGLLAVQALRENEFDIVFMDVQMPVMDGIDATAAIRLSEVGAKRRQTVVAMTAHAMSGDRERMIAAGMDDYLSKPLDLGALSVLVQKHLKANRSATEPKPATSPNDLPIFDKSRIAEFAGDDEVFTRDLIESFIRFAEDALQRLTDLVEKRNLVAIAEIAHSLKSSSGSIGASRVFAAATSLEIAANANEQNCQALLDEVAEQYQLFRENVMKDPCLQAA